MDRASNSSERTPPARRRKVLVVDDSTTIRRSVEMTLQTCGYEVTTAACGEDALALLRQGLKPDLLLTDIVMPGMGGIELIRQARQLMRFTPIIALTTQAGQTLREDGRAAGATAWALKPTGGRSLMDLVESFLPPG